MFNANTEIDKLTTFIRDYFASARVGGAVVGISGGKDSTVVAALLARALGAENVLGVLMPNGVQRDIGDSREVVRLLGINSVEIDIQLAYSAIVASTDPTIDSAKNIAPRVRMATLYALAQNRGWLVAGTTNASEAYVGYGTKWGDMGSDINPIREYYTDEIVEIGNLLGLPKHLVCKAPADGLSDLTDEQALGVTYAQINAHARGEIYNEKIQAMHDRSLHKRVGVVCFARDRG